MNIIKKSALVVLLLSLCACAQTQSVINVNNLYGGWDCKYSEEYEGIMINMDFITDYVRNGRTTTFGTISANMTDNFELSYTMALSGNWEIRDSYLIETTTEIKAVNIDHPEYDDIIDFESLIPRNFSESSKILELTNKKLSIRSEFDGTILNCYKKTNKSFQAEKLQRAIASRL